MALAPGVRLGVYAITAQIGEGGMGQVYRATDTTLGRQVAIKILPDALASDPERLVRFEREAKTLASLNHPHIAAIYAVEQSAGLHALVMELVEGEDLSERIARGAIPLDEALPIAKQIADALEAAHEQGIIHRDLKPANIKVREDGTVKVLDFGLAKLVAADGRDGASAVAALTMSPTVASPAMMTGVGVILGTAAYMAPEQARGKAVDSRADIWAFGCVLFEMLTGTSPFDGETVTDILAAIVKSEPAWRELPTDTPLTIRSLLRRCLRKAPAERLRDIGDARLEIQDAITAPGMSLPATPTPRPGTRWVAIIPWALTTALAVVVAFFGMQTAWRRAAPPMRTTVRLEMNLPTGVELAAGLAQNVAVSSDGQRVAFIGVLGGVRQLYVRRLDQFEAVAVRGTENSAFCFFSPDGLAVGLVSTAGTLRKVSLADGLVVTLASDVDLRGGAAWGTNDRITFVHGGALWHMPADGGPPSQLTKLADRTSELSEAWPTVVAGGRAILFTSLTGSNRGAVHIEALSLDTGLRHVVVGSGSFPLYASSGQLVFFRDGALLAAPFDVQRLEVTGPPARVLSDLPVDQATGAPQVAMSSAGALVYAWSGAASHLVWVSRQGVEQRITDTERSYTTPSLAPDGHRVVVGVNGDLWMHDFARATFTRLTSEQTVGNGFPVWMPNGKRVVFRTRAGLRWIDTDGSGRSQDIPHTLVGDYPQSVAPDGSTLLLMRLTPDMSADLEILSLRGDESQVRPFLRTSAYEGGAQFSPDGRWVAYSSDESGQMEVYVRPFSEPDRKQVSTQGGRAVRWNPNGKELFYRMGNKTMAVSVSGTAELTFSAPRLLFEQRYAFGSSVTAANYDVSPDGERFVMVKDESGSGRLNVVLNWTEELKRLVPTK